MEQLETIDKMLDEIDKLVIDMKLPRHSTRSLTGQLYAFYSDLEAEVCNKEDSND